MIEIGKPTIQMLEPLYQSVNINAERLSVITNGGKGLEKDYRKLLKMLEELKSVHDRLPMIEGVYTGGNYESLVTYIYKLRRLSYFEVSVFYLYLTDFKAGQYSQEGKYISSLETEILNMLNMSITTASQYSNYIRDYYVSVVPNNENFKTYNGKKYSRVVAATQRKRVQKQSNLQERVQLLQKALSSKKYELVPPMMVTFILDEKSMSTYK